MKNNQNIISLFFFTFLFSLIVYGFGLFNYSLPIDAEGNTHADFMLANGRWALYLLRLALRDYIPYFTLLLALFFVSLFCVLFCKLIEIKGIFAYIFSILFLSFPQLSYQLYFITQADGIALAYLTSLFTIIIFLNISKKNNKVKNIFYFIIASLLYVFSIAFYQSFLFTPIVIYLIYFLCKINTNNFYIKNEVKKTGVFLLLIIASISLYIISLYIIKDKLQQTSYLADSYLKNQTYLFFDVLKSYLKGEYYYGNKLYIVATILFFCTSCIYFINKKVFLIKIITLFLILVLPFFTGIFIFSNFYPPRIFVASGISFAFILVNFCMNIKKGKLALVVLLSIVMINILYISKLYVSDYRTRNYDIQVGNKIDMMIRTKYPNFDSSKNSVYFSGALGASYKYKLENSDTFGGSFFSWDGGNNDRILNFLKYYGIADYKLLENENEINKIKDSIKLMPIWPNYESIQMVDGVVLVKLGMNK